MQENIIREVIIKFLTTGEQEVDTYKTVRQNQICFTTNSKGMLDSIQFNKSNSEYMISLVYQIFPSSLM